MSQKPIKLGRRLPFSVSGSADLPAHPHHVYSLLTDSARRPAWMTELSSVRGPSRPVEVGDRFEGESSILFHDFVGVSEVTAAEPGMLLSEEVIIGARFTSRWELSPLPGGTTHIRHEIHVEFPGGPLSRPERWILRLRLRRMQRQSLEGLAALLRDPVRDG